MNWLSILPLNDLSMFIFVERNAIKIDWSSKLKECGALDF